LLIANTPEIFETTAKQAYFLLSKQGDITFGLSGWLTLDSDTGFRANGDFISQLVESKSVYYDSWVEIGYVELDKHKITKAKNSAYYEITFRVVSNYLIPGNWSVGCSPASVDIIARDIDRHWYTYSSSDNFNLDATSMEDIPLPLYDTFFIQYVCSADTFIQFCPSALYGSDTQCIKINDDVVEKKKRSMFNIEEILQDKTTTRVVCTNAANSKGCVGVGGAPGACPKTNSTCASEGFKDACAGKKPNFCKR